MTTRRPHLELGDLTKVPTAADELVRTHARIQRLMEDLESCAGLAKGLIADILRDPTDADTVSAGRGITKFVDRLWKEAVRKTDEAEERMRLLDAIHHVARWRRDRRRTHGPEGTPEEERAIDVRRVREQLLAHCGPRFVQRFSDEQIVRGLCVALNRGRGRRRPEETPPEEKWLVLGHLFDMPPGEIAREWRKWTAVRRR